MNVCVSGSGAEPDLNGRLPAAQRVVGRLGPVRGLDTLLFGKGDGRNGDQLGCGGCRR
jgi:hypothetical protein